VLAFFDGAVAYIRDPLEEQQSAFHLAGAGVGMRLTALDTINAALDVAVPLTDATATKRGDMRFHFLVSSVF
jgi:hemolysin activation/secretion protein